MHLKLQGSFFHHYHFLPALLNGEGKPPHKKWLFSEKKTCFFPKCWKSGAYSQDVSQGVKYPKTSLVCVHSRWIVKTSTKPNSKFIEETRKSVLGYPLLSYLYLPFGSHPSCDIATKNAEYFFLRFAVLLIWWSNKKNKHIPKWWDFNGKYHGDQLWQKVNNNLK